MDSICSEGRKELPLRSFVPARTDSGAKGWLITYPPHQPPRRAGEVGPINDHLVGPLSDRLTTGAFFCWGALVVDMAWLSCRKFGWSQNLNRLASHLLF